VPNYADLPVLVDQVVLDEAVVEAREHPECEIAGFLLGRVLRDEKSQEVFVAVTGLASSSGTTEASETSVTFTPASFAGVRNIIQLRAAGESAVGWYHSHPFKLCAECPLPTPPECIAKVLFYSQDDIHLMETTFDQPFMVGLLAAIEPRIEQAVGHLPVKLYGWHSGEIKERGFEVVRAAAH
jgi:proteasome lid subunit RPN8/RPN11